MIRNLIVGGIEHSAERLGEAGTWRMDDSFNRQHTVHVDEIPDKTLVVNHHVQHDVLDDSPRSFIGGEWAKRIRLEFSDGRVNGISYHRTKYVTEFLQPKLDRDIFDDKVDKLSVLRLGRVLLGLRQAGRVVRQAKTK